MRKEGEREGEKHQCVVASCTLPTSGGGAWPATQACALTGNRTSDPLVHRPALSPLSYTSQGNRNSFNEVMQQMEDDGFVVSAVKER